MDCPHCNKPIAPALVLQEGARLMGEKRKIRGGGRKLIGPRCPCGLMTLARAKARGKSLEHAEGCEFRQREK